ncbi:MAG: hypothetical protein H0T79_18390 [Deltaproteobacteria bacterium]|nr:hypothetical protein [Deltaproteobacteria bacterium]
MAQERVQTDQHDQTVQPTPTPEPQPKGPGTAQLQAMIAAGRPDPTKVVALIDAHRGERDAMFTLLHTMLGNAYVQQVVTAMGKLRASIDRKEVAAGDPSDPEAGSLVASQELQGAKWRTADGDFTGSVDKKGLDTRLQVSDHDALHGKVGTDQSASLAWERDGKSQGELYGRYKSGKDMEAGVRRTWDVDGGALTAGARHQVSAAGATDGVFGDYKRGDTKLDGAIGLQGGQLAGSAGFSTRLNPHDTVAGSIAHDSKGTTLAASGTHALDGGASLSARGQLQHGPEGTTGSLGGTYKDASTQIDGTLARGLDRTSLTLGASEQLSPELSLAQRLSIERPDHGAGQATLGLSEKYRSGKMVQGLDLTVGHGARDYASLTGSMDAKLGDKLYGGAWGSASVEHGKQGTAQLGASLTFTTSEKTALTLAGVLDHEGALETRLQLDVFKSKISGVGDIADHKKDALVSLFVSYSQGGGGKSGMLDDRFGASQLGAGTPAGSGQVMGGIRIKF